MMNVIATCLVLASLTAAGVQIPLVTGTVEIKQEKEVIVKEGHRAVEIEYEGDDGSTKVNIFPKDKEVYEDSSPVTSKIGHGGAARELVCDAFGKCKHKVAHALGKSKDVLLEKAHDVKDKVGELEGEAEHGSEDTVGKVKDVVSETGRSMQEAGEITKEKVKGVAEEAIDTGNTLQAEFEIVRRYVVDYLLSPSGLWASGSMKLLGLSVAYGTAFWVTFLSSYIAADALPRQQFADLQSKIYPVYFKVIASGIGMLLLSHCLSSAQRLSSGGTHFIQALNLFASLLVVLFNLKYLEPRANKILLEKMKLEKEEGKGMGMVSPTDEPTVVRNIDSLVPPLGGMSKSAKAFENPSQNPQGRSESSAAARAKMEKMSEQLKKLNSLSSFLNIATVMSLTWHLFHLGQIIHA